MYEHQGKGTPVWTFLTLLERVGSYCHFDILSFLTGMGAFERPAQLKVFFVCAQPILVGCFHFSTVASATLLYPLQGRENTLSKADVILLLLLLLLVATIY